MTNEQSVTLLRRNKRAMVEALRETGFSELTDDARVADFADYIRWAGGLRDVTVSALRKRDGKRHYFTTEEWLTLTATEQDEFLLRGVRLRAYGLSFTISPDTKSGLKWATLSTASYSGWSGDSVIYDYADARHETELAATRIADLGGVAEAAEAALSYRVFTEAHDGVEDGAAWAVPTARHWIAIFRCIDAVNDVFSKVWSSDFKIQMAVHWCINRLNNTQSYVFRVNEGGKLAENNIVNTASVRFICEE